MAIFGLGRYPLAPGTDIGSITPIGSRGPLGTGLGEIVAGESVGAQMSRWSMAAPSFDAFLSAPGTLVPTTTDRNSITAQGDTPRSYIRPMGIGAGENVRQRLMLNFSDAKLRELQAHADTVLRNQQSKGSVFAKYARSLDEGTPLPAGMAPRSNPLVADQKAETMVRDASVKEAQQAVEAMKTAPTGMSVAQSTQAGAAPPNGVAAGAANAAGAAVGTVEKVVNGVANAVKNGVSRLASEVQGGASEQVKQVTNGKTGLTADLGLGGTVIGTPSELKEWGLPRLALIGACGLAAGYFGLKALRAR